MPWLNALCHSVVNFNVYFNNLLFTPNHGNCLMPIKKLTAISIINDNRYL